LCPGHRYTFTWAPTFPYFFKPQWGINTFGFGGSADGVGPVAIVASGWTDQYNGTMVSSNSTALSIYYSTKFESSTSTLTVVDLGPASARLTLKNDAVGVVGKFDTVRFDRYFQNMTTPAGAGAPTFKPSFFFNQHSGTGALQ
jgi:hypothetical protein